MERKKIDYEFVNVQREYEDAPTQYELDSIEQGDLVKVILPGERFWVKVSAVRKRIAGIIDNRLVNADKFGIDYGDVLIFGKECVLEIYKSQGRDKSWED